MRSITSTILILALAACTSERSPAPEETGDDPQAPAADATSGATASVSEHTVQCGCSIASVGHCGNYIEVAGEYLPIANGDEFGLGGMQWCGQGPVTVQASGEAAEGEFRLSSIE
ncbi:MAG: hypothetical protein QGI46_14295 [Planctomycetota bacterium]|nr:hypothetical protein [Planctomycetota bacterium]